MEDKLRALELKFVLAISLGLFVFYYFFYYNPPNEAATISAYEEELIQLDGEIKRLDREISEGHQTSLNLEKIKKEIKALSSYFDQKPNSRSIEQIISEEARATGISFTSLQARQDDSNPGYYDNSDPNSQQTLSAKDFIKRNIIEASFSGTFIELMRFLSYLSRIDKVISLKQIELRSDAVGDSPGVSSNLKLTFRADFETYEVIKDVNEENLVPAAVADEVAE